MREVGDSFTTAVTATPAVPPLDPARARIQHAAYTAALEASGFQVRRIAPDEAHPDGCFIEDAAIVVGDSALLARPGHPSRRGEVIAVERELRDLVEVERVAGEASLDGGDVLQMGSVVFVGVGRRTDAAGADQLDRFFAQRGHRVIRVPVGSSLHLKSSASALDAETLLVHRSGPDHSVFADRRVITVEGDEPEGANVVRLADGAILVASHRPATAELVEGLGYRVVTCDVSEFARADGGLTCLSIRIRGHLQS